MSNRTSRQNPMLAEILIVLLFFALSACVLVGVFASAHKSSEAARSESEALLWAENLVETFALSEADANEFLSANDWTVETGIYVKTQRFSKTEYTFTAMPFENEYESGSVLGFRLTAFSGENIAFELPAANFSERKASDI